MHYATQCMQNKGAYAGFKNIYNAFTNSSTDTDIFLKYKII